MCFFYQVVKIRHRFFIYFDISLMVRICVPKLLERGLQEGILTLSDCPRLLERLNDSPETALSIAYGFEQIEEQLLMKLSIKGVLSLRCMRCMDNLTQVVDVQSTYELVEDINTPMGADHVYEQVQYEAPYLDLATVVSDELLLTLPEKHAEDCSETLEALSSNGKVDPAEGRNPFAKLANHFGL